MMLNKQSSFYSNILILFITVFVLVVTPFFVNWQPALHPFTMDVNQYYSYLVATFIDHDIFFNSNNHSYWLMETGTHQVVPKVTYGVAFFYAPFFLIANLFSAPNSSGYEAIYSWSIHYGCVIYVLLGFWFLRKVLLTWFTDLVVAISLFLLLFATNLFYYTLSESESVHGILFFLISLFLYHVIKWHNTKSKSSLLWFMLCAGFICLIRPTECLVLLFPLLIGVTNKISVIEKLNKILSLKLFLILAAILFILPILPQLVYWKIQSGSFLFFSYGSSEGFFWNNPQLLNVFFSFKKGLFIYTPILIFSIPGFFLMYQKNKMIFWPVLFYFIINTYFICSWWDWAYGGSFGMRAFIHSYSILVIPFTYFINWIIDMYDTSYFKKGLLGLCLLLSLFFCFLNVFQSNLYKHHIIHWDGMTKEAYQFTFLKKNYTKQDLEYLQSLIKRPDYEARRHGLRDE
jgi:hypothetical protein